MCLFGYRGIQDVEIDYGKWQQWHQPIDISKGDRIWKLLERAMKGERFVINEVEQVLMEDTKQVQIAHMGPPRDQRRRLWGPES